MAEQGSLTNPWKSMAKLLFVSVIFCAPNVHYVTTLTENNSCDQAEYVCEGNNVFSYIVWGLFLDPGLFYVERACSLGVYAGFYLPLQLFPDV